MSKEITQVDPDSFIEVHDAICDALELVRNFLGDERGNPLEVKTWLTEIDELEEARDLIRELWLFNKWREVLEERYNRYAYKQLGEQEVGKLFEDS